MQLGQLTKLTEGEEAADNGSGGIGDGTGVHNAIDAEDEREDDNQRQQEQNLPRQRHKHAQLRLTDRAEEIGRDRLDAIDKREEHIDAEVALRELEIHLAARSEHADDLPREQLEAEKRDHRQHRGRTQRQQVGVLNTVVQLSAVIVADDGLDALRNADDKGHEDHVHLGDDARTGQRDVAAVDRECPVVGQRVVHDDLHHGHGHLVETGAGTVAANFAGAIPGKAQAILVQLHGFKVEQIPQTDAERDDLANDRRQRRATHAHVHAEDEERIENGVDDGTRQHRGHRVAGASVRQNQLTDAGVGDEEREPDSRDAGVFLGIGQHVRGCAEEFEHRR